MRPEAALSAKRSTSATATSFERSRASAAAADMSSPPKAKQSSLSCAILNGLDPAMRDDELGDRFDIAQGEERQARAGDRRVRSDGDNACILRREQRLAERGAIDFELWVIAALVALDEHEIDRAHAAQHLVHPRLGCAAQLMHQRPAPIARHHHFTRTGLAVPPGILARLIDVEIVMRVLERRDADAALHERRHQARDQSGFAASAPSCKSEDPHCRYVARLGLAV